VRWTKRCSNSDHLLASSAGAAGKAKGKAEKQWRAIWHRSKWKRFLFQLP